MIILSGLYGIVMFAFFEADLTTQMTIQEQPLPLRSFKEIAASDYEIIIREGTSYIAEWREAKDGSLFDRLLQKGRIIPKEQTMDITAMELKVRKKYFKSGIAEHEVLSLG